MAATTPVLPLHCNICPKKPDFSDVSHLLTHVASKGHLAHYYKIKIRSAKDPSARAVIDTYDQWYVLHNVEQLMAERMQLKDRKRPRQKAPSSNGSKLSKMQPTIVDPMLSALNNGDYPIEQYESMTYYPPFPPWNTYQSVESPEKNVPPMALWRTKRPRIVTSMILDMPKTPLTLAYRHLRRDAGIAPFAQMWPKSTLVTAEVEDDDDGSSEATKLKGVYWPGMDIFDAATPEMKRTRNQKKDTSVAAQLERHSLFVEPTEMIFTPLGSLKKERVISGQANFDSSPDRMSPPTPKPKRRQSTRQPLAKKDANIPSLPKQSTTFTPFPGYGPVHNSTKSQVDSKPLKKQTRAFNVFEDDDSAPVDNATTMKFLTAGFRPATHSAPEGRTLPHTLLDINTGTMYHNNYFAEAMESYHPAFYGMPYYGHGYYGATGVDYSRLFSRLQSSLGDPGEGEEGSTQQTRADEHAGNALTRSKD